MSITDQIARLMFNHKHPEALVPPSILNFNPIASCNCISQHVWHDSSWPFKTINNKSPGKQQHKPTTCWQKKLKSLPNQLQFHRNIFKKIQIETSTTHALKSWEHSLILNQKRSRAQNPLRH